MGADVSTRVPELEGSIEIRIGDEMVIPAIPEAAHEAQLTREEVTAAVHHVHDVELDDDNRAELLADLRA